MKHIYYHGLNLSAPWQVNSLSPDKNSDSVLVTADIGFAFINFQRCIITLIRANLTRST